MIWLSSSTLWREKWDEFNDVKFWVNETTGESTYDAPTVERFLPSGWVMSEPPPHIFDEETGELLDRAAIEEIESIISDWNESEFYSMSLDEQSTSVDRENSRVTFTFPETAEDGCKGDVLLGEDKAGVDAEAAIAAERILKRKRNILLQKRKAQRNSTACSAQNSE